MRKSNTSTKLKFLSAQMFLKTQTFIALVYGIPSCDIEPLSVSLKIDDGTHSFYSLNIKIVLRYITQSKTYFSFTIKYFLYLVRYILSTFSLANCLEGVIGGQTGTAGQFPFSAAIYLNTNGL
jgi:hypothetical protein